MGDAFAFVMFGSAVLLVLMLYFWPAINAIQYGHQATFGIVLLNLLLGWTLLGWIVAFVWSYQRER